MVDSNNIAIIRQNLIELKRQIDALDVEIPSHAAIDAGKILAVDSSGDLEWKEEYSYTPPAYSSTEEVSTGHKWIDGKNIYCKSYIIPEDISSTSPFLATITLGDNIDEIIDIRGTAKRGGTDPTLFDLTDYRSGANNTSIVCNLTTMVINLYMTFSIGHFGGAIVNVYYTKATATRSDDLEQVDKGTGMITGEDPEPIEEAKETKSRKKSNK